jgi:uncharacterized protein DUF5916/cellulose/xylan binding protein with CBM9 domain
MRFSRTYARALAIGLFVLCAPSIVGAQDRPNGAQPGSEAASAVPIDPEAAPRPTLAAVRAIGPITMDGVLDEAAWFEATPATDFVQSTPSTGLPATEKTEVRILFDDETLYIGAMLYDSDPEGIIAQQMVQDFYSPDEDVFGVSLDTFLDRRNAYYLIVNPNGAIRDAQAYDNSRTSNAEWEGIMRVESSIHDDGWSVELAIPFSTLRFDPTRPDQVWGLNFLRRVRRKTEDSLWAPVARRTRVHRMAEAGTLTGLPQLRGSRNITVKPFLLGENVSGSLPDASELGGGGDGGLDVKWGLTPRLTADLTWRTDFSQVEADQEQVNLDRFPLFFPEKREFFIENSGTYAFGDVLERNYRLGAAPRDFTLFHSRRIGLDGGLPVPIVAGGRLTGRAVGFEVGVLNMQTRDTDALSAENFTVARVRRTVLGSLDLGGIFINRQATDGPSAYNRSWGVDANARLLGNMIAHLYLAETYDSDPAEGAGDNRAAKVMVGWRDALWNVSGLYRTIGDDFNPEVGFVRRRAVKHYYGTVGVHPRSGLSWITEINPYVEVEHFADLGGMLESRNLIGAVAVSFLDGSVLTARGTDRYENLVDPFTLPGGVVPVGVYGFQEGSVSYVSSAARTLSGQMRVSGGGYFQGSRRSFGGSVVWKPNAHFGFDIGADHNVIDLDGDPFTVDVLSGRLDYAFSTKLLAGAWVQYNDATEEMITNFRLNFIHSPLSDLFVVFSERRDTNGGGVLDRRLTTKLTKLFAF